ncbi:MAG: DUF2927 domain-containing protein, partial [Pseudomonadota bacterium]
MAAVRAGNWDIALSAAEEAGPVARDIVEWHRLRAGRGTYAEVIAFLERRSDWPGEALLRRWEAPVRIGLVFGASVPPSQRMRDTGNTRGYARRLARATGHPVS